MNKKNIVLVLLVACFLTIMAISIWGKLPELSNRVVVDGIVLYDSDNNEVTTVSNSARKEKVISIEYSETEVIYSFKVAVTPENATDVSLNYEVLGGAESIEVNEMTYEEYKALKGESYTDPDAANLHYYSIKFVEQNPCLLCFTTNKTDAMKKEYLQFAWTGSKHNEVIDI